MRYDKVQENIYKKTDASSTRLKQKEMKIKVNILDYIIEGI